jgi:hypothetical protein
MTVRIVRIWRSRWTRRRLHNDIIQWRVFARIYMHKKEKFIKFCSNLLRRLFLTNMTWWNGGWAWHTERSSETLRPTLTTLPIALINQFHLTGRIDTPKTTLAWFILRSRYFYEIPITNKRSIKQFQIGHITVYDVLPIQTQVVTNWILPSLVCACPIVGIIFRYKRIYTWQC